MADYLLREAVPDDAEQLIAYLQRIGEEPDNGILIGPGEFDFTLEQERDFIQSHAEADNSLLLVAEHPDTGIIGVLNCSGGHRRANRHQVTLGITLHQDWRNQGIGTAMMQHAIEWAKASGVVKRIALEVFAHNTRAMHVYEKLGFQVEGREVRAYYKDGQFIDSFIMALLL